MDTAKSEKRADRHSVGVFVGEGPEPEAFGLSRNISESGIFVVTQQRPDIGSLLIISFIWDIDTFTCEAKVVRHEGDGVALIFVEPDSEFLRGVNDLVSDE
ncbi:PilZ domain-containing protein [Myxococcota bacterium]|nr:PilZ domain-containing protein [Myxococcota bacterium]